MFERIVVGYAGDRAGRDGVVLASQLASMCGAELTIVFPYHPLLATVPSQSLSCVHAVRWTSGPTRPSPRVESLDGHDPLDSRAGDQ